MVLCDVDLAASVDDRRITGAAAQVACQPATHGRFIQLVAILQETRHRDYKARRAKATLGAVTIDHRPLHGAGIAKRGNQDDTAVSLAAPP